MINPLKYYTITELMELGEQSFFPITNRATILKLIETGKLKAQDYGTGDKPNWQVKGEDVLTFLDTSGSFEKKVIQNKNAKRTKKEKDEKSLPKAKRKIQGE